MTLDAPLASAAAPPPSLNPQASATRTTGNGSREACSSACGSPAVSSEGLEGRPVTAAEAPRAWRTVSLNVREV